MLSAQVVCCIYLLTLLTNVSVKTKCLTQIRLLLEQSGPGLHCFAKGLLKHFNREQTTFVVIGALNVKSRVNKSLASNSCQQLQLNFILKYL